MSKDSHRAVPIVVDEGEKVPGREDFLTITDNLRKMVIGLDIFYIILIVIEVFFYCILLTLIDGVVAANTDGDDFGDVASLLKKMIAIRSSEMVLVGVFFIHGARKMSTSTIFMGIITQSILKFVSYVCSLSSSFELLMNVFYVVPHLIVYHDIKVSTKRGCVALLYTTIIQIKKI